MFENASKLTQHAATNAKACMAVFQKFFPTASKQLRFSISKSSWRFSGCLNGASRETTPSLDTFASWKGFECIDEPGTSHTAVEQTRNLLANASLSPGFYHRPSQAMHKVLLSARRDLLTVGIFEGGVTFRFVSEMDSYVGIVELEALSVSIDSTSTLRIFSPFPACTPWLRRRPAPWRIVWRRTSRYRSLYLQQKRVLRRLRAVISKNAPGFINLVAVIYCGGLLKSFGSHEPIITQYRRRDGAAALGFNWKTLKLNVNI